jgi:hypothetical protein
MIPGGFLLATLCGKSKPRRIFRVSFSVLNGVVRRASVRTKEQCDRHNQNKKFRNDLHDEMPNIVLDRRLQPIPSKMTVFPTFFPVKSYLRGTTKTKNNQQSPHAFCLIFPIFSFKTHCPPTIYH